VFTSIVVQAVCELFLEEPSACLALSSGRADRGDHEHILSASIRKLRACSRGLRTVDSLKVLHPALDAQLYALIERRFLLDRGILHRAYLGFPASGMRVSGCRRQVRCTQSLQKAKICVGATSSREC